MKPLNIRIKLLRKGRNLSDIARRCEVHRELIRYALRAPGRYRETKVLKIREAIAQEIGLPVEKIWPQKRKPRNHVGFGARKAA
jgi:lambda repressor-like predicted transcriptional regulator